MRPTFRSILLIVLFSSCSKESTLPLPINQIQPEDHGIYDRDSTLSDAFCDFRFLNNDEQCWNADLTVHEDCHYNLLFTRYDNGWTASDATYSMPLPDGKIMWMFGDTFLGKVRADRSRANGALIRNTIVIQNQDELETLFQGTLNSPAAYVSPTNKEEWYWPLDATIANNEIHWMLGRLENTEVSGIWSFRYTGFDLAVLDLQDYSLQKIIPKVTDPDISYGSCILEDGQYTYLYGISTRPFRKRAHIARVESGDLTRNWTFYDGTSWVVEPSDFVIQQGVSDQFSVLKDGNKYYLVTHEIIFGKRIFIAESDAPEGPFVNIRVLYCTPESGGNIFTYNSFVHPELSEEGELRISYNINSFDFYDILENVDLYRPKFISIKNWR